MQGAVSVIGMHRTGTSMVMHLLAACGVAIGDETKIMSANAENPAGYWEYKPIVRLNDALLAHLGGAWDRPPLLQAGWAQSPDLEPFRQEARQLLDNLYSPTSLWGWKDPRTSLLLEFWESLLEKQTRYIVCIRHPLEVALSLCKRTRFVGFDDGLALWQAYYEAILAANLGQRAIVTNYFDYFTDPAKELRRILEFLELSVEPAQIDEALTTIASELYHNKLPAGVHRGLSEHLRQLFLSLSDVPLEAYETDEPVAFFRETVRTIEKLNQERISLQETLEKATPESEVDLSTQAVDGYDIFTRFTPAHEMAHVPIVVKKTNGRHSIDVVHPIAKAQDQVQTVTISRQYNLFIKGWFFDDRVSPHATSPLLIKLVSHQDENRVYYAEVRRRKLTLKLLKWHPTRSSDVLMYAGFEATIILGTVEPDTYAVELMSSVSSHTPAALAHTQITLIVSE